MILDDICLSLPDLLHFTSRSIDTAVNGIISFFFKRNGSFDLAFLTSLLGDSYTHWVWEPLGCSGCTSLVLSAFPTLLFCSPVAWGMASLLRRMRMTALEQVCWRWNPSLWTAHCPVGVLGLGFPSLFAPVTSHLPFKDELEYHIFHVAYPAGWIVLFFL